MTEIQNPKQLAFDLICNLEFVCKLMLAICYFRYTRDKGYPSLSNSIEAKCSGILFCKKENVNPNRNRIDVFFSRPNLLF